MRKEYYEAHFSTDEGLLDLFDILIKFRHKILQVGEYSISHIVIDDDGVLCQATAIINKK